MKVSFAVSGLGRLALAAIDQADALGVVPEIVLVDSTVDLSVCRAFENRGVEVVPIRMDSDPLIQQISEAFEGSEAGLWMLTFNRILPDSCISKPERLVLNTHMSLLPSFRGLDALNQAINAGVKIAGASIHEVSSNLDAGRLVAQCAVPVIQDDTVELLGKRLWPLLKDMYLLSIYELARGAKLESIANETSSFIGHKWVLSTLKPGSKTK